jgi:hypothetical protein
MKKDPEKKDEKKEEELLTKIINFIMDLVTDIPLSEESISKEPKERAKSIVLSASTKAALVSGTLSLPLGPMGMLTVLPDIVAIWKIQRNMVADIAAAYGKTRFLGKEQMIYCLFKHAASQVVRDLVVRVGERLLIQKASIKVLQDILRRIGIRITQRIAGRTISRWIPVGGAIGIALYAFYDTSQVGKTAIEFFERDLDIKEDD